MDVFSSGSKSIRIERYEPSDPGRHPALLLVHGSGGSVSYWLNRFAPALAGLGVGVHAPHYFDATGTTRATAETILDGKHFLIWLATLQDAVHDLRGRPTVDAERIGILGISLGGYLAVALSLQDAKLRLVIELSGGMPPGWEGRVSPAMPPILALHGAQDDVVPVAEGYKLQRALSEGGARCELQVFPNEDHWFSAQAGPKLLATCGAFLLRNL